MNPMAKEENCLQTYFEQQDDKEAASIVASVVVLLSSNNSVISGRKEGENNSIDSNNSHKELNNILLTKESEISALKEVILKWRYRALDALDQLEAIQLRHNNELKSMESRCLRKLEEKEDIILNLREQVDYLVLQHSRRLSGQEKDYLGDTDSFVSTIDNENEDTQSIISSIYDREVEQRLPVAVQEESNYSLRNLNGNLTSSNLKSEAILDSIQDTMRAIEQELNFRNNIAMNNHEDDDDDKMHGLRKHHRHHRRSPTYGSSNTYYSSSTLIDSDITPTKTTNKIKKPSFFINRIFKKAFPKLYNKKNTNGHCNISSKKRYPASLLFDDNLPRNNTEETLGVYSTTTTVTSEQQHVLNLLSTF